MGTMSAAARKAAEDFASRRMQAAKTKAQAAISLREEQGAERPTSPSRPPQQPAAKKAAAKKSPKPPEPMLKAVAKTRPQDIIWLHKVFLGQVSSILGIFYVVSHV